MLFSPKCNSKWLQIVWQSAGILILATVVGAAVNAVRSAGLSWRPNWTTADRVLSNSAGNLYVSLNEAKIRYFTQSAIFIDARSRSLYRQGHIDGALNLPFEDFSKQFPQVMQNIPRGTSIITYCDGNHCDLSEELAFSLLERGYENVQVLKNGWTLWRQAGLPVAIGSSGAGPP